VGGISMPNTATERSTRIEAVDIFRGIGIALMIAYHFSWDLTNFGYADFALFNDPAWLFFRTLIVGMFLFASGVSHALIRRAPIDGMRYVNRIGVIAGAAIIVSLGTGFAFPNGFVFFGILHLLAAASILILPFPRLPWIANVVAGIAVIWIGETVRLDLFNAPALVWLGLATAPPFSVDYVPVFPWFGGVLLGLAAGQYMIAHDTTLTALARWQPADPVSRLLQWAGRHTLIIYLLHQPILFGSVWAVYRMSGAGF